MSTSLQVCKIIFLSFGLCVLLFLFFFLLPICLFCPFYIWHLMQIINVSVVHRIGGRLSHIHMVAEKQHGISDGID